MSFFMEGNVLASLGINLPVLLGQIVNFLVLLFVLKKFIYNPILKTLDERSKLIKDGAKAAEDNLKKQAEIETKEKEVLKKAQKQGDELIKKAKDEALNLKNDILVEAKKEAEKVAEKQKKELQDEFIKQQEVLKKQTIDISTQIAKKIMQEYLDEGREKNIIDKQLKMLAQKN
ncbi:F0F1 ATP synthase subunit B [Candidatus Beckwithbacteria bacterium]|nr:F0F1 ATP synthase subunit B [Candidatus Beckwithbacteria bacterium]